MLIPERLHIYQYLNGQPDFLRRVPASLTTFARFYAPTDVIEFRFIHAWKVNTHSPCGSKQAHAVYRTATEVLVNAYALGKKLIEKMLSGYHVYFSPNPRFQKLNRFAKIADVRRLQWFYLDFDRVEHHAVLRALSGMGLPCPSLTVKSGHGIHVYWKLIKPLPCTLLARQLFSRFVNSVYQQSSIPPDLECKDVARILRLPGSLNLKETLIQPCVLLPSNENENANDDENDKNPVGYSLADLFPNVQMKSEMVEGSSWRIPE